VRGPHRSVAHATGHRATASGLGGGISWKHLSLAGLLEDAVGRERVQARMDVERAPEELRRSPFGSSSQRGWNAFTLPFTRRPSYRSTPPLVAGGDISNRIQR
jgi:hypothetical protein